MVYCFPIINSTACYDHEAKTGSPSYLDCKTNYCYFSRNYECSARLRLVSWRDCCSLHAVMSSVIYYSTHGRKNGLLNDFRNIKKVKQNWWRDLTWIWCHLCLCPFIDHGQQPMKIHTAVTLLYKKNLLDVSSRDTHLSETVRPII